MNLSTPFYIEKRNGENHLDLCGEWEFAYLSEPADETEGIPFAYKATLPSSVYWNMHEAGLLPHPYEGTNSKLYSDLDQKVWYYRRKFTVDKKISPETDNAYLVFDGVGYYSRLYLNGELLGEHEGMFGGPVCDVADKLLLGENEIVVEVKAHNYGWEQDKRLYGSKGTWHVNSGALIPWNISRDGDTSNGDFTTFGIWREVRLEIMPKKHIARPYLYTKSIDGKNAVLGLEVNIATEKIRELDVLMSCSSEDITSYDYTFAYRKGLSGILSGESVGIRVIISDGDKTVYDNTEDFALYDYEKSGFTLKGRDLQIYRCDIALSDVDFWYPNGMGEAKLYDVKIEMSHNGTLLDALNFKTGIRTIEQTESAGRKYRQRWDKYHFSVNGKRIFLKGMNWMPTDFLYDESYEDTLWALEQVKNAGIQLLRVWSGGGKPESDAFYEICDRLGIMVWQDAFLANHNSPLWNGETLENQVCFYLYRLRNHPSLAVHCGGNEQRAYHVENNAIQYIVQRNVEDLDFSRKYYRVTPDRGSMHTYNDMEPVWFRKAYGDLPFMAECGIHSFPNAKSLRQLISAVEFETPLDKIMEESFRTDFPELLNHFTEYRPDRIPRMLSRASHISDIRGITLPHLCEATGMASHEFYQFLCQSLREAYPRCVGLMPWVFKRTWTTTAIQLVDGLGEPIAPYYALKNAYAGVICLASLEELDYAPLETVSAPIRVINDSESDILGSVTVDVFSPALTKTYSEVFEAKTGDKYMTTVGSLSFTIPENWHNSWFFLRTTLREKDGEIISSSLYPLVCLSKFGDREFAESFRSEAMPNLIFENGPFQRAQIEGAEKSVLSARLIKAERHGDRISADVEIKCKGMPAYPVVLEAVENRTVSYMSDNFFFMDEGEVKTVTVEIRDKDKAKRTVTLSASAWNADEISIEL